MMILMTLLLFGSKDLPTTSNGKELSKPTYELKLTEELRLGPEDGEDHYLWTGTYVSLTVNKQGHIFVADTSGNRIMQYDAQGKFVRQIGGPGEGPGEFSNLQSFQILRDGTAVSFEGGPTGSKFHFYDKDLNYKRTVSNSEIGAIFREANYDPNGRYIAANQLRIDNQTHATQAGMVIYDHKFKAKETLIESATPAFNMGRAMEPAYWSEFLAGQFKPYAEGRFAFVTFDSKGRVYTATASKYEVIRRQQDLTPERLIGRDYTPIHQSEEEIEAVTDPIREMLTSQLPEGLQQIISDAVVRNAVAMAEFPSSHYPIQGLTVTADDHLMVIHAFNQATGMAKADIFDEQGKWVGSFAHGDFGLHSGFNVRMVFQGNKAYTIETVDDENYLVRYDVKR